MTENKEKVKMKVEDMVLISALTQIIIQMVGVTTALQKIYPTTATANTLCPGVTADIMSHSDIQRGVLVHYKTPGSSSSSSRRM